MKKVILGLAAVAVLGMTSCGSASIEDVNVDDIKDACGCVDAVETVSTAMLAASEPFENDYEKLKEDEAALKVYESGKEKIDEIMKKCKKDLEVKKSDMKECGNYDKVDENMEKIMKM